MSRNIERQAFVGFGLTIFILCVVMAISYRAVQSLRLSEMDRSHSFKLVQALKSIELELQDADTAQREFLLTNDRKVLVPYELILKHHDQNFSVLTALTSRDSALTDVIGRLKQLVEAKHADMADGIDLRDRVGFDAAVKIVLSGKGNDIMNQIRQELRNLIVAQNQKLALRDAEVGKEAQSARLAMIAGTIAAFLVAVFAGLMIRTTLREREFVAKQLAEAHQDLERKVLERTAELKNTNVQLQTEVDYRQNSEAALRKQRHFLDALLESLNAGIVACDTDGKVTVVNNITRNFLGFPEGAIPPYGAEWTQYYEVLDAERTSTLDHVDFPLGRAIAGEKFDGAEIIIAPHGAPARVIWATGQPIIDENNQRLGAVVALHDITEIKETEKVRQAQQSAEAANNAKSEFLSRMSHELRTPLNAILGFAQLMQMDVLSEEHRESTEQILKGGRHLLLLINEVLDISRIEAGRMELSLEPVLVSEAVDEVISLINPIAQQRNVTIQLVCQARDGIHVMADRQRLKQVLMNLLSNAVKYNRYGGWVKVSYEELDGKRVRLLIADSGIGISPEYFHRLFRPFDRLSADKSEIEGTGLGLCLAKGFVEVMNGTMGILCSDSEGSTFWVELSEAESQVASAGNMASMDCRGQRNPNIRVGKVLYIEDNISNVKLVERIVEQRPGITLISAIDGQLGIELARSHMPDLIFLDLNLSDMHGSEVLRQLKESVVTASIPVVAVSADASPGQTRRILAAGATNYLTKPINVTQFLDEIDKICTEREPL